MFDQSPSKTLNNYFQKFSNGKRDITLFTGLWKFEVRSPGKGQTSFFWETCFLFLQWSCSALESTKRCSSQTNRLAVRFEPARLSTAMDSFLMVAVVLWRCFLVWQFGFRLFHYLGKGIRKDNTSGAPWYQEHERGKHEKQLHVIDLYKLSRRILWKPFWEFWYTWTLERPDP